MAIFPLNRCNTIEGEHLLGKFLTDRDTKSSRRHPWVCGLAVFRSVSNLKYNTLLMLIYFSGLRIVETLSLRVQDIRNDEGQIAFRHGKDKKDRQALSKTMLQVLCTY